MSRKNRKPYDFYYKKPQDKKESKALVILEKIIILISLSVYGILFPPFFQNQTLAGHDAGSHLSYLRIFTDALSQGQFPVRWIEWVAAGQNQPLFSFYQPFLYYLGQIPHFFGSDIMGSLYQTVLFLWIFSGFITFLFVKNLTKNTLAGVAASLVYVFAPYHIVDVFVRAAYPEVTALAFAPGLFWAVERFFTMGKRFYLGFLAFFFAAVFISHPPTLIMFSVPFAVYFLYLLWQSFEANKNIREVFLKAAKIIFGLVLGAGLASFFAIPAFLQQSLIKASSLSSGYLDFHNHFVCLVQLFTPNWGYGTSVAGCSDNLSFQVGIVNWLIILASIVILSYYFVNKVKHKYNLLLLIFLSFSFFGMYMTLSYSQPFWEGIPYLAFLQFPWRFLSIVIFSTAVLSGLLFTYLNKRIFRIILFIFFTVTVPVLIYSYLQPAAYLPKNYFAQDLPNFYQGIGQGQQNGTAEPGYMPVYASVLANPLDIPASEIWISDQNGKINVLNNTFTYKKYRVLLTHDSEIKLYIHYFPGWKFYINKKEIKPYYSNIYGFSYLAAGKGENIITADFTDTPVVSLANLISLLSVIALIILIFTSNGMPSFSYLGKIDITKAP